MLPNESKRRVPLLLASLSNRDRIVPLRQHVSPFVCNTLSLPRHCRFDHFLEAV